LRFDVRIAESQQPGDHITIDGYPGHAGPRPDNRACLCRYGTREMGEIVRPDRLAAAMFLSVDIVARADLRTKREWARICSRRPRGSTKPVPGNAGCCRIIGTYLAESTSAP